MAEIIKPDCFDPWQRPNHKLTRQLLEQVIRTLDCKLRKACAEDDQITIEKIFDMRTKALRLLGNMFKGVLIY